MEKQEVMSKIATPDASAICSGMQTLHLAPRSATESDLLPRRPNFGKLGRKIALTANYFSITVPHRVVHHYDITLDKVVGKKQAQFPETIRFRLLNSMHRQAVMSTLLNKEPMFRGCFPVYDGRQNLYTAYPLNIPTDGKDIILQENTGTDKPDIYTVHIKKVAIIDFETLHEFARTQHGSIADIQSGIMVLDTILRYAQSFTMIPVGRSFFTKPLSPERAAIPGGRELWLGHFQSVRLTQRGIMLNVDKVGTTFYKEGPVLDFMCNLFNKRSPDEFMILPLSDILTLKGELVQVKFSVIHQPYKRVYRVAGISKEPARNLSFSVETSGTIRKVSVPGYFRERYGVTLRYSNLPCLEVKAAKGHVSYFPVEVCDILPNQPCHGKLNNEQMSAVIQRMITRPLARFEYIKQKAREIAGVNKSNAKGYELVLSTQDSVRLWGRVLTAPGILFDGNAKTQPDEGSWEMRGSKVFRGSTVTLWALFSFSLRCDEAFLAGFKHHFMEVAQKTGVVFREPVTAKLLMPSCKIDTVFRELKAQYPRMELVMCVLPAAKKSREYQRTVQTNPNLYKMIKYVAETEVGLRTQCVTDVVAQESRDRTIATLCLKINIKLGGANSTLEQKPQLLTKPVMVIGVDTSQPNCRNEGLAMIVAAVGSIDVSFSQYARAIRTQTGRIEIVQDLKGMIKELLLVFYNRWKQWPVRIILFRDGVSEGQFFNVGMHEVKQVGEACGEVSHGYKPNITFLVVQKGHHTRFMPQDEKEGVGRYKNIPPGTTVDTDVCHPVNFDFFLCSHLGIQGTSRPAHYTVFKNDDNLQADDIQQLTYYLCHTYGKCHRSLSIPPAVQYAHLVAERARLHMEISSMKYPDKPVSGVIPVVDSVQQYMYYI